MWFPKNRFVYLQGKWGESPKNKSYENAVRFI